MFPAPAPLGRRRPIDRETMTTPKKNDPSSDGAPVKAANTLRLQGMALYQLLEQLDAAAAAGGAPKRDYRRWSMNSKDLQVDMQQPGGTVTSLRYVCRDLSGSGVGILHSAFLHVGTRCIVQIPHPTRGLVAVPGSVVRCRLAQGKVHDVGIKFRTPISVREFIDVNPFEGRFSLEKIDPAKLAGTILHIDDSAIDRRLVRHLLQETSLDVVSAESGEAALARSKENFDIVLCDVQMPEVNGHEVCRRLREAGVQTTIILASAEESPNASQQAKDCGANALIYKPISRESLLASLAEFLLLAPVSTDSDTAGPIYSTLSAEDPLATFVPEFVEELRKASERLTNGMKDENVELVRQECFQIMGAAGSLGLSIVGKIAKEALTAVSASMSCQESSKQIRDLIFACHRVKGRAA